MNKGPHQSSKFLLASNQANYPQLIKVRTAALATGQRITITFAKVNNVLQGMSGCKFVVDGHCARVPKPPYVLCKGNTVAKLRCPDWGAEIWTAIWLRRNDVSVATRRELLQYVKDVEADNP